jgi:GDP-4-dehydro-6-deoxy-D-mannose reductase
LSTSLPSTTLGPAQSPDFLLPTLVEQLAAVKDGRREPVVKLRNLASVRDLSDVRDVVQAYHLALRKGSPGEAYNVGSGRGESVWEFFELVRREAAVEVEVKVEPSRSRAVDIPYLVADPSKVRRELGWETKIPPEKTVRDMLESASKESQTPRV